MKKLIVLLIIVLLGFIVFFQFKKYTRLNAPAQYEYPINPKVDVNYYDQKMVADYYELAFEVGSYARSQWFNHKIDVLYKDNSSDASLKATAVYNQMKASVAEIENHLLLSSKLKSQGFSNADIRAMDSRGESPKQYLLYKKIQNADLKFGDEGSDVLIMQQELNKKGLKIRIDGIFDRETEDAVMKFQLENNLFADGIADERTLLKLISN